MGTKNGKIVCFFAGIVIMAYSIVMMIRGNFYLSTAKILVVGSGIVLISLYEHLISIINSLKSKNNEACSRHKE